MKEKFKAYYAEHKKIFDREVIAFICCWYPGALIFAFITNNQHPDKNLFAYAFTHLFTIETFLCWLFLFVTANAFVYYWKEFGSGNLMGIKDEDRNFMFSAKGTYGTGGFMDHEEILTVLHEKNPWETDEIILGKNADTGMVYSIPNNTRMNHNIAVYGAPGTGKTRCFVRVYALQAMKRGARLVLDLPNATQTWKAKSDLKDYLSVQGIQYGERSDGSLVLPYNVKEKILTESGNLVDALDKLGAGVKVEHGESMAFTDPKGELLETLAPLLKEEGYEVKVFNLKDATGMRHSDAWNCLAEIENDDLNAQILADTIIKNTTGKKGEDFWSDGEMNLLKALCLYVERAPDIPTEMGEVYNLLTRRSATELDAMFAALPYNDETAAAKQAYSVYSQANDNVKGGMIIGLGSRLQVFQGQAVRDITAHSEINLKELGQRKCAYFIITSDQQSTFDFLAALFYSMMFVKLVGFADTKGFQNGSARECWVPVNFILDEFPNIAQIMDFTKKISTVRSRAINIAVIFQNLPQMQNRYPYGQWEEILGDCDTNLFLGCTDQTTAKYISDKTDIATIAVSSHATNKHTCQVFEPWQYKENNSEGKRAVMNPGEVLRLPLEDEMIFLREHKPIRCQKFDYSLHPDAKRIKLCKVDDHIPQWRQDQLNKRDKTIPKVDPIPVRKQSQPDEKSDPAISPANEQMHYERTTAPKLESHDYQPPEKKKSDRQKEEFKLFR